MDIILGGNYNRIIHKFEIGAENGYAFGLRYGVGYQEKFVGSTLTERIQPVLSGRVLLNQIIQSQNWNYRQLTSSNFTLALLIGVSFHIL